MWCTEGCSELGEAKVQLEVGKLGSPADRTGQSGCEGSLSSFHLAEQ